jgi:membrane associated rhomboid family serine protease
MFNNITPFVRNILIINVVVFVVSSNMPGKLYDLLAFHNPFLPNNPDPINPLFKPWQILTHMFMHGGIGHLFFNMFGFISFGSILETYMGSSRFLKYYIISGLGAVIVYGAYNYFEMSQLNINSEEYVINVVTPMVGASGALYGILFAFAFIFPNIEMQLMFIPFPIKAKYLVTLFALYDLVSGLSGFNDGIGHFAHIGGLVTGFILIYFFNFKKQKGLY